MTKYLINLTNKWVNLLRVEAVFLTCEHIFSELSFLASATNFSASSFIKERMEFMFWVLQPSNNKNKF